MQEILTFLKDTIDDSIFSKSEKKAIKEIINDKKPDKRKLDWLRSEIFKLATENINGYENQKILDWLETANKLLIPKISNESFSKTFFSPGDECVNTICSQISHAINSIKICVFTISDNRIADKIIYAHKKKVDIKIITDNDKLYDAGSDINRLAQEGINIKIDKTRHHMHHKFAIFDKKNIITGSYNWTRSAAEYNHENISLTNDKKATNDYNTEFNRLWEIMEEL